MNFFFEKFKKNPFSLDFKMVPLWWFDRYQDPYDGYALWINKITPLDFAMLHVRPEALVCCLDLALQSDNFKKLLKKWFTENNWFETDWETKWETSFNNWDDCEKLILRKSIQVFVSDESIFEKIIQIFPNISRKKILMFFNLAWGFSSSSDASRPSYKQIILNFFEKKLLTKMDVKDYFKYKEELSIGEKNEFDAFLKVLI